MISKGSRAGKYNFPVPLLFSIVCSVYIVVVAQCVSVGKVANKWIEITL